MSDTALGFQFKPTFDLGAPPLAEGVPSAGGISPEWQKRIDEAVKYRPDFAGETQSITPGSNFALAVLQRDLENQAKWEAAGRPAGGPARIVSAVLPGTVPHAEPPASASETEKKAWQAQQAALMAEPGAGGAGAATIAGAAAAIGAVAPKFKYASPPVEVKPPYLSAGESAYEAPLQGGGSVIHYYDKMKQPVSSITKDASGSIETHSAADTPPHPDQAKPELHTGGPVSEYPGTSLSSGGPLAHYKAKNGNSLMYMWDSQNTPMAVNEYDKNGDYLTTHTPDNVAFPPAPVAQGGIAHQMTGAMTPAPAALPAGVTAIPYAHVENYDPKKADPEFTGPPVKNTKYKDSDVYTYPTPTGSLSVFYTKKLQNPTSALVLNHSGDYVSSYSPNDVNLPMHPEKASSMGLMTTGAPTAAAPAAAVPYSMHVPGSSPIDVTPVTATYHTPDGEQVKYHYDKYNNYKPEKIELFDKQGKLVDTISDEYLLGQHSIPWHPDQTSAVPPDRWEHYSHVADAQHANLTEDHFRAMSNWSESGHAINDKLWEASKLDPGDPELRLRRDDRIYVADLADAINKSPLPMNVTTYSGVQKDTYNRFRDINVGEVADHPGFLATSLSRDTSDIFREDGTLKVLIPGGTKALIMGNKSSSPDESEILLQRGGMYRKIDEDPTNKVITVEPVTTQAGMKIEGKIKQTAPEPGKELVLYPKTGLREYNDSEFPWEYREYTQYAEGEFPDAFKSFDDFKAQYDKAPIVHLSEQDLKNMDYSTAGHYINKGEEYVKFSFAEHRNVDRILGQIKNGDMPPPVVLKTKSGYRILGGNTRMGVGAALGWNLPVKVIDISGKY
jgi:hypothetical protein